MPAGDRTGPTGDGPMTGRGAGFCGGATEEDFVKAAGRRGFGQGFGAGRQRGRGGGRGFGFGRGRAGGEDRRVLDLEGSSAKTESLLHRLMDRLEAIEKRIPGQESED